MTALAIACPDGSMIRAALIAFVAANACAEARQIPKNPMTK
jgi:hypothetical protein